VPCLATNCTAMADVLADGRGILINHEHQTHPELTYIDPFGNGHRYFADLKDGIKKLLGLYTEDKTEIIQKARQYAEDRTWETTILQMEKAAEAARRESIEPKA
jgi:glycosyltransferase involved in cell wall biosynthesis